MGWRGFTEKGIGSEEVKCCAQGQVSFKKGQYQ